MNVKKIALFASGSGTNAQNIIQYFAENEKISTVGEAIKHIEEAVK